MDKTEEKQPFLDNREMGVGHAELAERFHALQLRAEEFRETARLQNRRRRFHILSAFFWAVVMYWLVQKVFQYRQYLVEIHEQELEGIFGSPASFDFDSEEPYFDIFGQAIHANSTVVVCQDVNVNDTGSTFSFNLSTDATKVAIVARGPFEGFLSIENGGTASSNVEVDVELLSVPDGGNSTTLLCSVQSADDGSESVVLISQPKLPGRISQESAFDWSWNIPFIGKKKPHAPPKPPKPPKKPGKGNSAPPKAKVVARIPDPESLVDTNVTIPRFEVRLPEFAIVTGDIEASFGDVVLVGNVTAEYLNAVTIVAVAPFGDVKGNFTASNTIKLIAGGGEVDANVELWNDQLDKPSVFVGVGETGVNANVSLKTYDNPDGDFPPSYVVKSIGKTVLDFVEQPVNSSLVVIANGKTSSASVKLHPAFEGFFEVTSVFGKSEVFVTEGTKDPSGEGRTRVVRFFKTVIKWVTKGTVSWVKETVSDDDEEKAPSDRRSFAKLVTVKAPALLTLG